MTIQSAFALTKKFLTFSSNQIQNPYARYSLLQAKMVSTEVSDTMEVVPFGDIVCHFASCPLENKEWIKEQSAMVVLCLDRVSTFTGNENSIEHHKPKQE